MNQNYTYAAIFDYSEEGFINISFPQFEGVSTCVEDENSSVEMAQEILALTIQDFEESKKLLPPKGYIPEIGEKQKVVFINVWMPYYRSKAKEVFVKKTLTIPAWLDELAKNNNINFSAVLVQGLKEKLEL